MSFVHRAISSAARRLQRPELVATFYGGARRLLHEEIAVQALIAALLRQDATYVDVGTNRGQLLAEALRVAPRGQHLAFEPIPELAAEVRRKFPGVDTRQLALSEQPGTAEFCHFTTMDGWSGLHRSPEVSDVRGHPEYIQVELSTLDAELAGISPRLIKIDVEGAELDVVRGGRELLASVKPFVIFEHVAVAAALYSSSSSDLWELFDELGYDVFSITGEGPLAREAFAGADGVNWLARPTR
ncbi:MAG TPA: FkbM family methyltransferase [Solirubrobacteraceae bacterium]|jgi:FkbM family methyltransferase|nr:FkbM family methyltransferase [Solirubrobacteraceae bacterium]